MPSKGPSESDTDHAASATDDADAAPTGRELRLGSVAGEIDEVSDEDEAADGMCMLVYVCGVSICMCVASEISVLWPRVFVFRFCSSVVFRHR